jgi:hypothetical protein
LPFALSEKKSDRSAETATVSAPLKRQSWNHCRRNNHGAAIALNAPAGQFSIHRDYGEEGGTLPATSGAFRGKWPVKPGSRLPLRSTTLGRCRLEEKDGEDAEVKNLQHEN